MATQMGTAVSKGDVELECGKNAARAALAKLNAGARESGERHLVIEQLTQEVERTKEQTQQHLQRITLLREINLATTSTLDLSTLLNILLEKIDRLLPYPAATTVRLCNKQNGELEPLACRNLDEKEWKARRERDQHRLAKLVVETKTPLAIDDLQADPRRWDPEFCRKHALVSYLGVPLVAKGEVLGILSFYTREPHQFTAEEVEFLATLAGQAAIAIHNSQLYEQSQRNLEVLKSTNRELERSTKEQRALRRFLSDLLLLDVNELLQKMTKQAARLFKAEYVWLRLFDDAGKIRTRAVAGEEDVTKAMSSLPEGGKLSGRGRWMLDHRSPLAVRDIAQEADRSSRGAAAGLHGFLGAPLFSREQKPLGVLHVMTRAPRDFSQRDLDLIEQFANGAAIALENAQLFEQMTLSKKELEKANRIKSHFLGMMSHELRTPLSVIIGNIAILKEKHLGEINSEQETRLAIVERNAADLFRMLQGILDITRLEEGKMPVHFEEFTVEGLLDEIRADFAELSQKKGVRLEIHGNGVMRPMLSDRMKLKEILDNLVSNAMKFTKKGRVEVRMHYHNADDRIEFIVQDTGIGMRREELEHIFDIFYQVDSSDQRKFGGAGLGLNIVKRLVDLLQGEIQVESEPGKGSTFTVAVPRKISVSHHTFFKAGYQEPFETN